MIYITGIGAVTTLGWGYTRFAEGIVRADTDVRSSDYWYLCPPARSDGSKPNLQDLLCFAAKEAIHVAANNAPRDVPPTRCGLVVATSGPPSLEEAACDVVEAVAEELGIIGPAFVFTNACSSGMSALEAATWLLESDRADRVLLAGANVHSLVQRVGFTSLGLLRNSTCMPFDRKRQSVVLGEAGGCLVLDKMGTFSDRLVRVGPIRQVFSSEGELCPDWRAIVNVIGAVGRGHRAELIVAHGTGTMHNDAAEKEAFDHLFRDSIWATSIKASIGHTLEASGVLNIAAAVAAIEGRGVAVVQHTEAQILDGPVHLVRPGSGPIACKTAICCAYGIDGNHAAALFSAAPDANRSATRRSVFLRDVSRWFYEGSALPKVCEKVGDPLGPGKGLVTAALHEVLGQGRERGQYQNMGLFLVTMLRQPGRPAEPYPLNARVPPSDFLGTVPSFILAIAARSLHVSGSIASISSRSDGYFDMIGLATDAVATGERDEFCMVFLEKTPEPQSQALRARAVLLSAHPGGDAGSLKVETWGSTSRRSASVEDIFQEHRLLQGLERTRLPAKVRVVVSQPMSTVLEQNPLELLSELAQGDCMESRAEDGPTVLISRGVRTATWILFAAGQSPD